MKPGISTACFYPLYTEDALRFLVEHRVQSIELFLNSDIEFSPEMVRAYRNLLAGSETSVLSVHPYTSAFEGMMFFTQYERRFQDGLQLYKRYAAVAKEVGASYFVLHGAGVGFDLTNEFCFERIFRLSEALSEEGIVLLQENCSRMRSGNLDYLEQMKKALGERAQFVLDVKQTRRSGERWEDYLRVLGKSIRHVHISDGRVGADCLPLQEGSFDTPLFFEKLRELGFEGGVILELYRSNYQKYEQLLTSYQYMARCPRSHVAAAFEPAR